MKTMLCVILDRSGSMGGKEADVVGGVNKFIATICFVRFDNDYERFRLMAPLADCRPMEASEYQPRGSTALNDAIGHTLTDLDIDWKREQPERAYVVIVTDGGENASSEYTRAQIKTMIEAREASGKWGFIYLGANVDAFSEARSYGVSASNFAGYSASAAGIGAMSVKMSQDVSYMRSTGSIKADMGGTINEDGTFTKTFTPPQAVVPPPVETTNPATTVATTWSVPQ